ncbi:MAG: hypothetical protein IPJ35_08185 [Elusimicrobia bacterium]|nr:hypothetical protein [Elusimicrobiota bacterium]
MKDAKRFAKQEFFTELLAVNDQGQPKHLESEVFNRFQDVLRDRTTGTPARVDPAILAQPTVGFVGRLVVEKFNMGRAWARFVIRALVRAGVNVVLFAPIQQKATPRAPARPSLSRSRNWPPTLTANGNRGTVAFCLSIPGIRN